MSYNLTGAAQGGNLSLSRAGGATANVSALAAATTYTVQNVTYSVAGKLYFKATAVGAAGPVVDGVTGLAYKNLLANSACCYAWTLNAAGVVGLVQGVIVPYTDVTANSTRCPLPVVPDTLAIIGYSVVKAITTAVGAWLPGTNNWTGVTGITADPYVDVFAVPPTDPLTA